MKIILESTTVITEFKGAPCRIWEGHTENGVHVYVLIAQVAAWGSEDNTEFERDLQETVQEASPAALRAFNLRHVH